MGRNLLREVRKEGKRKQFPGREILQQLQTLIETETYIIELPSPSWDMAMRMDQWSTDSQIDQSCQF